MRLRAVYRDSGSPLDLTDADEITVILPNADGTTSELTLTGGDVVIATPAVLGDFSVIIDSAVSALLNPGIEQNFDVVFEISGKEFTVSYQQALSVFER